MSGVREEWLRAASSSPVVRLSETEYEVLLRFVSRCAKSQEHTDVPNDDLEAFDKKIDEEYRKAKDIEVVYIDDEDFLIPDIDYSELPSIEYETTSELDYILGTS
jgi:hypothetical protein